MIFFRFAEQPSARRADCEFFRWVPRVRYAKISAVLTSGGLVVGKYQVVQVNYLL